jgi:hypothetical protein
MIICYSFHFINELKLKYLDIFSILRLLSVLIQMSTSFSYKSDRESLIARQGNVSIFPFPFIYYTIYFLTNILE